MDPCSVGRSGVGHRVASVSVCDHLEDQRSLPALRPFLRVLDCGVDSEDVHSVDLHDGVSQLREEGIEGDELEDRG